MAKGRKNRRYTGEFKQLVVEDVLNNRIPYTTAMRKYGITACDAIQKWERIYIDEGPEALYIERRGRASSLDGVRKGVAPKQKLDKSTNNLSEKELLK